MHMLIDTLSFARYQKITYLDFETEDGANLLSSKIAKERNIKLKISHVFTNDQVAHYFIMGKVKKTDLDRFIKELLPEINRSALLCGHDIDEAERDFKRIQEMKKELEKE